MAGHRAADRRSLRIAVAAALPFFEAGSTATTILSVGLDARVGASFELLWDPLAALMALIVTGVGTLIHVFAIGYMHGDERFPASSPTSTCSRHRC